MIGRLLLIEFAHQDEISELWLLLHLVRFRSPRHRAYMQSSATLQSTIHNPKDTIQTAQ
jgi:hypothetical protein